MGADGPAGVSAASRRDDVGHGDPGSAVVTASGATISELEGADDDDDNSDHSGHQSSHRACLCCSSKATPDERTDARREWRGLIAFLLFGFLNNFGFVVMQAGATDILEGRAPVGVLMTCNVLPSLAVKLVGPWFMHKVPYAFRIVAVCLMQMCSFLVVAIWGHDYLVLALVGVSVGSMASGTGEPTFLGLTSFYSPKTVGMWSSGTGFAGVGGALFYVLLTSVLSAENALFAMSWFPLVLGVNYFFVLTAPGGDKEEAEIVPRWDDDAPVSVNASGLTHADVKYNKEARTSLLNANTSLGDMDAHDPSIAEASTKTNGGTVTQITSKRLSIRDRIAIFWPLQRFMIPLILVYFAEYTILSGVASAVSFPTDNPPPKDQYKWFTVAYQVAVLISRSSVQLFHTRKVWIFAFFQCAFLITITTLAHYDKLPEDHGLVIMFGIIFCVGLLGGACYVNAFYAIRTEFSVETREFALTAASVASDLGIVLSGVVAVYIQDMLCCAHDEYCNGGNYKCGTLWGT